MKPKRITKNDYSEIKEHKNDNGTFYWTRPCPVCKKEIKHKSLIAVKDCHRHKRKCNICGNWNRGLTTETSESLRKMGEEHSKRMIEFRKNNPPWNKGLSMETNPILKQMSDNHTGFKHNDETKKIIGDFSRKFWQDNNYRQKVIKGVNENRNVEQWRKTMEELGYFTPLDSKSDWEGYKQLVWYYTNKNDLSSLENYDKRGRVEIIGSYSLDHKYSIAKGYKEKIPAEVIGSKHNLEFIPSEKNDSKKTKCSITKNKLEELFYGTSQNKI